MKHVALAVAGVVALGIATPTLADTNLFRDIAYGAPASNFTADKGYYDCSQDAGTPALCVDDITFLQEPFGLALKLSDGKVTSVLAVADFSETVYSKLFGALSENFTFVGMEDQRGFFDLIEHAQVAASEAAFTDQISNFESVALNEGQLTYYFVELSLDQARAYRSATELLRSLPSNVRQVQFMVTEDQDGAYAMANFSFPTKDAERMQSHMDKAKKEKF